MPLIHCNFYSQVLQLSTSMDVILPLKPYASGSAPDPTLHPTLYLLHGYSDDHTIWQRRTSIERYVEDYDLAVVMPEVHHSFYTDMAVGMPFWTFISEEVPYIARSLFPLSAARQDNFVAGLSMGGYGAFKMILSHPERFAAGASLSGLMDIGFMFKRPKDEKHPTSVDTIFGDQGVNSPNDLFYLARQVAKSKGPKPHLYQWCGTEDGLYRTNVKFRKHAEKLGLDLDYEEGPGDHTWKYWDEKIQTFLAYINPAKLVKAKK